MERLICSWGEPPCQDLSVAGKRAGFGGKRSSLALEFIRLAYESRCKWIVWENVPGVFSSRGGGDFATFLSLLSGTGIEIPRGGFDTAGFVCNARRDRYGLAWRVLDAQFTRVSGFPFAVPQRRRRVFVVGYFGDWTRAVKVLLEPDRLQWDTPTRAKTREIIAGHAGNCLESAGREYRSSHCWEFVNTDVAGTLKTNSGSIGNSSMTLHVAAFSGGQGSAAGGLGYSEETSPTLRAAQSGSNQVPDIICVHGSQDPICNTDHANAVNRNNGFENVIFRATQQGNGECFRNLAPTITAAAGKSGNNQPIVLCFSANDNGRDICKNISPTMRKGGTTTADGGAIVPAILFVRPPQPKIICFSIGSRQAEPISQYGKIAVTLEARHDSSPCADRRQNIVFCYENHAQDSRIKELKKGVSPQLNAKAGTGGNNLPLVQEIKCYDVCRRDIAPREEKEVSPTITRGPQDGNNNLPILQECHRAVAIAENIIGQKVENGGNGVGAQEEIAYTQNCSGVMGVCTDFPGEMTVRRLTPLECERLMGFPDNYTRISWNGRPETECPDAPRYKACGNSMCVNVMRWIGLQIDAMEDENASTTPQL